MPYSQKQADVLLHADKRWNILCGAVSSGKTFASFDLLLLRAKNMPKGAFLLLGKTERTLQRNVLDPMRIRFGAECVSRLYGQGEIRLFGRHCYIAGANDAKAVSKIQGLSLVYAYGDEITTWNEDVFQMLKSRLREPGALFDGTCNPDKPEHWFKRFLDAPEIGAKVWTFTLDDNPFLPAGYVPQLKREYSGVWYDRFILGRWVAAEGAIYQAFADNPEKHAIDAPLPHLPRVFIGVDWGDAGSAHALCAVGITTEPRSLIVLKSARYPAKDKTPQEVEQMVVSFAREILVRHGHIDGIYCDHINTFINGTRKALQASGIQAPIARAHKKPVYERILTTLRLMGLERLKLTRDCASLADAFRSAVWERGNGEKRQDDGTSDIDSLDAFEYAWGTYQGALL